MKTFFRFAALSGVGWLLDCALLMILAHLGLRVGLANFISSAVAALAVFLASRLLVFEKVSTPALSGAVLYLYYQIFSIFAASALIGAAVAFGQWLAAALFGATLKPPSAALLGKIIITPPQFLANFLISKFLIVHFRRAHPNA